MSIKMEAPHVVGHNRVAAAMSNRAPSIESLVTRHESFHTWREKDNGPPMDLMRQLYEHMPDAVFFISDGQRISACNRAAVALFGYEECEIRGRKIDFVWCPTPDVQLRGHWGDHGTGYAGLAITKSKARFPAALTFVRGERESDTFAAAVFESFQADREPLQQIQELQCELTRLELLIATINGAMRKRRSGRTAADCESVAARPRQLTDREHQVLSGVLDGLQNKMIAYHLGISPRTVEVHRANVMAKMGARNLAELMRMATTIDAATQPLETARALPIGSGSNYSRQF